MPSKCSFRRAIAEGAPGGGFTLRTTGSAHIGNGKNRAQKAKSIQCGLAMIEALALSERDRYRIPAS